MKQIFPFLVLFILLNSCTSEFKPATFKTTSINKAFNADISVTYDKATGNDELCKRINFQVEEAIITTLSLPEKKTKLEAILKDFDSEYVNFKKDFPDEAEPIWELNIETELTYQSEDIITIVIGTYEFKGGAHGNDKIKFINLDAKTGDLLSRDEIIEDINNFKTLAKTHFMKSLKVENKNLKIEDLFFGKPFQLPENMGLSDDGLVLLYNTYEVASYNQGYTEFVIPFDEVQPYLKVN